MATLEITADTFEETVTDNDVVLVDFWAEWCGPWKWLPRMPPMAAHP